MSYTLPEILTKGAAIQYNPVLAVALNRLINTRNQRQYQEALEQATQIIFDYEAIDFNARKDYGFSSNLAGMKLFMPLTLKDSENETRQILLESAVVELMQTKNIVSTIVTGRDSSVDEFINNGDWQLTISGFIAANGAFYPADKVQELNDFLQMPRPLIVEQELLNKLDINEIVVLSNQLNRTTHMNIQPYQIIAKQSKAIELTVVEPSNIEII